MFTSAHAKLHGKFDAEAQVAAHLGTMENTEKILQQQQPLHTTTDNFDGNLPPLLTTMDKEELEVETMLRKSDSRFLGQKTAKLKLNNLFWMAKHQKHDKSSSVFTMQETAYNETFFLNPGPTGFSMNTKFNVGPNNIKKRRRILITYRHSVFLVQPK